MTTGTSLWNGKHAVFAVVLVFAPMLPALLLAPLGWSSAAGSFIFATMAGVMASMLAGPRLGLILAAGLAVAEMLALPAAPYPVWAGLVMGVSALLYGLTSHRGLTSLISMAPIAVAFTIADPPVLDQDSMLADALVLGLFVLLGGLWGTVFGTFVGRKAPRMTLQPSSWRIAVTFALVIGVATGLTMAIVVATGIGHTGAWIVLTIIMVLQPRLRETFRKSLNRALGTALGFGIALAVALILSNETALLVLGMAFLTLAVYVKMDPRSKYWHFTMLLTPGIVLAEGAGNDVVATDLDRLWASFTGIAIALVLLVVFHLLGVRDHTDADLAERG